MEPKEMARLCRRLADNGDLPDVRTARLVFQCAVATELSVESVASTMDALGYDGMAAFAAYDEM